MATNNWSPELRAHFRNRTVFTVYPDRIWVGERGNPSHAAEWSWKPVDKWPTTPMPSTRGYYRHSDKSLHFYEQPSAYVVMRVKKYFATRGLMVKILDGGHYDRIKKRYAKRDFSRMRPESVVTRQDLIEAILEALLHPSEKKMKRRVKALQRQHKAGHAHRTAAWRHDAKQWQKSRGYKIDEKFDPSKRQLIDVRKFKLKPKWNINKFDAAKRQLLKPIKK